MRHFCSGLFGQRCHRNEYMLDMTTVMTAIKKRELVYNIALSEVQVGCS